jgi:hypothetical protein
LLGTIPVVTVEIRLQPGYIPSDDRDDGADPVVAIQQPVAAATATGSAF